MTYTYVLLEISNDAWDEIREKLAAADYHHTFEDDDTIDMRGIALVREIKAPTESNGHPPR